VIDADRAAEDALLVGRIARGDGAAFVIAYDRHSSFVFGSVQRFLGDREAAAEVVQDAFVTLRRRAGQFDSHSGSLLTWLLAIARHRAIDRFRAERRRPSHEAIRLEALIGDGAGVDAPRADTPPELVSDGATDPATVATRRWVQSVVRTGISELPEHERQVIVMGYSMDLSQAQIAERMEWPLGTVKSRTRRAMAQLRLRLGALAELDEAVDLDLPSLEGLELDVAALPQADR
jgi:RNA polymerase sigma-70 factor (ECF subfamily)